MAAHTFVVGKSVKQNRAAYWYEGSDTLEAGHVLCFNSDSGTAATATVGRGALVEKPASTNINHVAGLVAPESDGVTGPCAVIVIEPGCVCDGFTSLNCAIGTTVLAVNPGSYILSNPIYGGSTTSLCILGVALQTIDRSSTNGLVQMDFDPSHFGISIGLGVSTNLITGIGTTTGDVIPHMISMETAQTGGAFHMLRLRGELAGAGSGTGQDGGIVRIEGVANSTLLTASSALSAHFVWKTGATNAGGGETFSALYCKMENQDSTPAALATGVLCAARFVTQINEDPGTHTMLVFESEGSDSPDYFLTAKSNASVAYQAHSSAAAGGGSLKCLVGGTAKYIVLSAAA